MPLTITSFFGASFVVLLAGFAYFRMSRLKLHFISDERLQERYKTSVNLERVIKSRKKESVISTEEVERCCKIRNSPTSEVAIKKCHDFKGDFLENQEIIWEGSEPIKFSYQNIHMGRSTREVELHEIFIKKKVLYFSGYWTLRSEDRTFRMANITSDVTYNTKAYSVDGFIDEQQPQLSTTLDEKYIEW